MELQLMKLRKRAGYKNRDTFADKIGVNRYTYRSWEQGAAMMNLEQACLVCEVLDCTLDELVGRRVMREYADAGQKIVNICYEAMNERGKSTLVSVVQSMERDVANRVENNRVMPLEGGTVEDVA